MNTTIYKIRLEVAADQGAAVAGAIEPFVDSVTWSADEDDPTSTVVAFAEGPPDRAALTRALAALGQPSFTIERVTGHDWLAENKAAFPPIREGRFFIHVADYAGPFPSGVVRLRVPPAGAFGSGRHGSTQGCLRALDGLGRLPPGPMLDMGCGSGILGLAAAKVWRRPLLGVDIDPRAIRETLANARANGVAAFIDAVTARGYAHAAVQRRRYALIFANILAKPLMRMAEDTTDALKPGGTVILSGLLLNEAQAVAARHRAAGLVLQRRIQVEGWATLVMRKPAPRSPASRRCG